MLLSGDRPLHAGSRVVLVGGGFTTLALGAVLARAGCMVTLLEANEEQLGGHARSVTIEGLEFCLGPQYVWNFGANDIGERLLRYIGVQDRVHFDPMEPDGFEEIVVSGQAPFDVPMGLDRFRAALCARFPDDTAALDRFFALFTDLFAACRVLHDAGSHLRGGAAMRWRVLVDSGLSLRQKLRALRLSGMTIDEMLDTCEVSDAAQTILLGHDGIFAESADTLSAGVYASATGFFHSGAYVPREGFRALVETLASTIRVHGGTVLLGKRVTALQHERGTIYRVLCSDGGEYPADYVVSNLSPRRTRELLGEAVATQRPYLLSNSLYACLIGLRPLAGLRTRLARRNIWWRAGSTVNYTSPDMTCPPEMLYVGSPTANGYGNTPANPGDDGLVVFGPGSYAQAQRAMTEGDSAHEELKATIAAQVLATLDRELFPGIASRVRFARAWTPLDISREVGAENGAVYGRRPTVPEMLSRTPWIRSVRNLRLASATVGQPGIANAFQAAAIVAREIAGIEI